MSRLQGVLGIVGSIMILSLSCKIPNGLDIDEPSEGSTPSSEQPQQILKITGATTPYPAMEELAAEYEVRIDHTDIVFLESSQSSGGILAVREGLVDLGTVTRAPKDDESFPALEHQEFAKDLLVIATHISVEGINELTTDDLKAIYSGQSTNWNEFGGPDATIVVLDRAEDESAKRLLRKHYLGTDLGNSPNAIILRNESDLMESLQSMPYSIGAFSLAKSIANGLSVNYLTLNGVEPTAENLASGRYTMARSLGIVWSSDAAEVSQDFRDFIFSEPGANALEQIGYIPTSE